MIQLNVRKTVRYLHKFSENRIGSHSTYCLSFVVMRIEDSCLHHAVSFNKVVSKLGLFSYANPPRGCPEVKGLVVCKSRCVLV
jgi:hypothetical protein